MATKICLGYTSPMTVIADRYIVAFIGLTAVMLITRTKLRIHGGIWKLIVMSVFQPLLYFIFESYGINLTTSAFSSVMISLIPVVSMISGIFVLKELLGIKAAIKYIPETGFAKNSRDISVLIDKSVECGTIIETITACDELISKVSLFDIFESEKLGADKKSMAFNILLQSA